MTLLALAALAWLAIHVGISASGLRAPMLRALGANAYRGVYSLLSVAAFVALIWAFRRADPVLLWVLPAWGYYVLAAAMLASFVLFAGSVSRANPVGAKPLTDAGATGMIRVTRHPMMCATVLWALLHIIGNGELAATIFFGTWAITALAGMPAIDRRLAANNPQSWATLRDSTSLLPFGAILAGRNRLVLAEMPT